MSENDEERERADAVETSVDELGEIQADSARYLKTRLYIWAVRWTIGFGAIWAVTSYRPELGWLWWVGGAIAAASLVALLVLAWFVEREAREAGERIAQAKNRGDPLD